MDLKSTTSWLMRNPDPARWLKLADAYIQSLHKVQEQFVLPAEHASLKPVIESFANDTNAFAQYVRALRDGADGGAYEDLHDLYRVVSMRALQNERRTRIRKATSLLLQELKKDQDRCGTFTYDQTLRVARFVEQRWGVMRLDHLAYERRLRNTRRLTSEERNIALHRFWASVDRSLDEGHVPLGDTHTTDTEQRRELRKLLE